ncbi:DUF2339 domain-containing protein [Methylobrevis albus]|uniref:DUF2339 domain-containing protein n=1 Tax=Methylobrevis albus TaxID=2793297 RepID=A0A931MZ03_9HYPH|nr:DUF2339 domain-containing protein [Methylobrevis albus]MBH0238525.1 DUF2339 domain-containing protein [Methylobrevis albus]
MDALIAVPLLIALSLLVGAILGMLAFGRTRQLAARVAMLEARLEALVDMGAARTTSAAPGAVDGVRAPDVPDPRQISGAFAAPPPPLAEPPLAEPEPAAPESAAAAHDEPPADPAAEATIAPAPRPPRQNLEEIIGTRWAVWVGGLALGLGGIFLVRYSIEAGLLGPGARILAGLGFAALLLAAGEALRRRLPADEGASEATLPGQRAGYIPGVLTAAGTVAAFAAVFAAYAVYGFLGDTAAFVVLAAIALATLALAVLHGRGLAALGLGASYVTPLLVASSRPALGALAIYLVVVTAAALGVARVRGWLWLAVTAVAGSVGWSWLMILAGSSAGPDPAIVAGFLLVSFALAVTAFAAATHAAGPGDPPAGHDRVGAGMLGLFALPALMHLAGFGYGSEGLVLLIVTAAGLAAVAYEWPPLRLTAVAALALVVLAHLGWNIPWGVLAGDPINGPPTLDTLPALLRTAGFDRLIGSAVVLGLAFGAAGFLGALRSTGRTPLAVLGGFAPLGLLVAVWLRVAEFTVSPGFGLAALALAGLLAVLTEALIRRLPRGAFGADGAVAAYAVATIAALAVAATILFERGMLTVTLALIAPAIAYVASLRPVRGLRPIAVAVAAVVVLRFVVDPRVVGDDLGTTPVLNWLLYGYGVPAAAFFLAARLFARTRLPGAGRDLAIDVFEALAVTFGTLTLVLVIHHAMTGGDVTAPVSGLAEQALLTLTLLAVSLGVQRLAGATGSTVFDRATLVTGVLGLGLASAGLLVGSNPVFTGEPIGGPPLFNLLAFGYLAPALGALALRRAARRAGRPGWFVSAAGWIAGLLGAAWITLVVRHGFHRPHLDLGEVGNAELWAYSAVWLLVGVVLLGLGRWRQSRTLRLVSAVVVVGVVLKVFLVDAAGLSGAWRALSFIGLGGVLILIGLAYQRLLPRR